jgi:hypothetical protein
MTEYKVSYSISKERVEEFIEKVKCACDRFFFKCSDYTVSDDINNNKKVNLVLISTPSCRVSLFSHDGLFYAIENWDNEMYKILVY